MKITICYSQRLGIVTGLLIDQRVLVLLEELSERRMVQANYNILFQFLPKKSSYAFE